MRSTSRHHFGPRKHNRYWELAEEVSLDRDATPGITPKTASRRALAGNSVQRIDIPDKVLGRPRFIHDQALAGMLHGRVLRPENARAKLIELKEDGARALPGLIAIVRDGSLPVSSARPSMARRRLSAPSAKARPGPTASRFPTKTTWLRS
jgi:CO/xanthine dehydrogenase Mo-binding subunit